MKNIPLLIGSLVLTLLVVIGISVVFTNKAQAPVVPVATALLLSDTPHVKGKTDAKVTLVEFSDLQCPACKAAEPIVTQILNKYGDSLRFVYRHFPLRSVHVHAAEAGRAAEAAQKQGAFWAFHDKLFEQQEVWAAESDPSVKFLEYAKELKLNVDQFAKDLKDSATDARVLADERDGNTVGVNQTPTFFVNGINTDSAALAKAVDAAFAQGK